MSRNLRSVYDGLYVGIDNLQLSLGAARSGRAYARSLPMNPEVAEKYNTVIRPYWKQFNVRTPKKYWFRLFANEHKPFSEKYIPDDLWYRRIVPHFNNLLFAAALQDKCLLDENFPGIRHPVTPVRNVFGTFYDRDMHLLTASEAARLCLHRGRILVKPSVGSGEGRGINFYDSDAMTEEDMLRIFSQYGKNFLVQEKLRQHTDLARLSGGSVNTLRINTFLFKNEVRILSTILRTGGTDSEVDNTARGGYQCQILPDGHLGPVGFTHHDDRWEYVDAFPTGVRFADVVIPSFDRAVALAKSMAVRTGHFRIIGWDIAVAEDGEPVMLEYNVIPGQDQETNGPTFGDLTDEVLAEVFGRRKG